MHPDSSSAEACALVIGATHDACQCQSGSNAESDSCRHCWEAFVPAQLYMSCDFMIRASSKPSLKQLQVPAKHQGRLPLSEFKHIQVTLDDQPLHTLMCIAASPLLCTNSVSGIGKCGIVKPSAPGNPLCDSLKNSSLPAGTQPAGARVMRALGCRSWQGQR